MPYKVLLLGSGGREHALAWSIAKSPLLANLFIAPGNPGTAELGENVSLSLTDFDGIWSFIQKNSIDLTIVGPEQPLVDGIVNFLEVKNHPIFGPKQQAAMLEGSKEFAKEFMKRHRIPTADYQVFDQSEFDRAAEYITTKNQYPVVLKADGLAGGKGVFIPETEKEALEALEELKENSSLKHAASKLVIEEFMVGEEASVFAISDGDTYKVIGNAQDHKRIGEGDIGLNTGGMGAYSPAPIVSEEMLQKVEKEIIAPTISGMKSEGNPYKGILYCGLMITEEGPKVVEYNCRFGDPECQVILPRMKTDILEIIAACTQSSLNKLEIDFDDEFKCCVVLASGGYPEKYEKGKEIFGLDNVKDALVFHAGTSSEHGKIFTNGGRVLNVVGSGKTLEDAIQNTYQEVNKVDFEKAYYRTDIGVKGLRH
ncbi:MAG: phosphoribosylamine--glycine ligase [Balneolaceae bacterium]